jgi:2-furoyl-CoA dehydrogenase large subunit
MNAPVEKLITKEPFVGQSIERVEDLSLLTGSAIFGDDMPMRAGTLFAAILRSPHAHAEILSIDTSKALARPGVATVIIGTEVRDETEPFIVGVKAPIYDWALAVDRVRYVGEPVAVVVASDRYKAEDALDAIEVNYRPLPVVVDPDQAMQEDAPLLHPACKTNVVHDRSFSYGDPETTFANAPHRIALDVEYPRVMACPIEGYVVMADYNRAEGSYDMVANFQGPFSVLTVVPRAMRVPANKFRLRTPPSSGGSFGAKLAIFPYMVLLCLASKRTGKPVKWVEDRLEHLAASGSGPYRKTRIEAAVSADGEILGLACDHIEEYGACLRAPMPGPLYRMHGVTTGAYGIRNLTIRNRIVLTNRVPVTLVRGFGGPQIYFALERLVQRIAIELQLDPLDVIKRNLVPAGSFPYRTAAGALLDSGDYQKAIEKSTREGKLDELKRRRDEARAQGRLYGIGYACVVEPGVSNMGYLSVLLPPEARRKSGPKDGATATATVAVDGSGMVTVVSDSTPQGQGHRTVLAQIVADQLGLQPQDIAVNVELDTAKDGWSIAAGNYASRFAASTCSAAHIAAGRVRKRLAAIAGKMLDVPVEQLMFADGKIFSMTQPEKNLPFYRVAGLAHWSPGSLPEGVPPGLRETEQWSPPQLTPPTEQDEINTSLTYGFIFDYCGVEIDRDTGEVRIDKYVSVHDGGRILNPALAEGQISGALAQAFGASLYENFVYDADGSLLSGTYADYLLPTAMEMPAVESYHIETPSPFTATGAKGMGEGNTMSTPACIGNAVADALGIRDVTLPLIPMRIAEMLHGAETPPPAGLNTAAKAMPAAAPGKSGGMVGEGSTLVPAPREKVWETLLDPEALRAVIPGCESLDATGLNAYRIVARIGVGPVRGTFTVTAQYTNLVAPQSMAFALEASGPLGFSSGGGTVRLEPEGEGTRVHYDYSVRLSGKIAAIGSRMLEGASRVLIGAFFDALARRAGGVSEKEGRFASFWRKLQLLGKVNQ